MTSQGLPAPAGSEPAGLAHVARQWARAVAASSYVPVTPRRLEITFRRLLNELITIALSEPLPLATASEIGAGLVDAHVTTAQGLSATLRVLAAVPDHVESDAERMRASWPGVVSAVAEGFVQRLLDRVLREQQEIIDASIAARVAAEQALQTSEIRLQQAKDRFITTVSHELRTPLTPIVGYLRLLMARDQEITAERRRDFYQVMLGQADLLGRLIDDLLNAAATQQLRFEVAPRSVPLTEIIQHAVDSFSAGSDRTVEWLRDDSVGDVYCDPARLQQVLANLLLNAAQYSTPGTPITVSARRDGAAVEIAVRDRGPGIPAESLEAVFEAFERLGQGAVPGAGLGLHLARELVESMNGRIWVDPSVTDGAALHVALPG